MSALIVASSISKKYNENSQHMELLPTSLSIAKGKIYLIKGKSGSGKSTLLNILGGIDRPTTGKVYIEQKSLYDLPDREQSKLRSEKFGFIFQNFNLIPELTVFENIELPKHFNRDLHIEGSQIMELSRELDIVTLLNKKPYQLSGGEQQRVAIARALITNPELIFADEPTGSLDATNSRIISDLLVKIVKNRHASVIIVTHEENLIDFEHTKMTIKNGLLEVEE